MSTPYVEIANVKIDYSGGKKDLQSVSEIEVTTTKERKAVMTMNRRRRGRGWRSATLAVTGTIKVEKEVSPEVDWHALFDSNEEFLLILEDGDGGNRRHLVDCLISSIKDSYTKDGEPGWDVEFGALDNRPAN